MRWRRSWRRTLLPSVLVSLTCLACSGPAPAPEEALARGLGCVAGGVAGAFDGQDFADPYLRYVYPGEDLPAPPGMTVTYRQLDACFIVHLLDAEGVAAGPAVDLFHHCRQLLAALPALWAEHGLYNLRRGADPQGIALDTYAILAFLARDPAMGRVVLAGLDGDSWLPPNLYTGPEWFRLLADESWAARALTVTAVDPEAAGRTRERIWRESLERLDPGPFEEKAAVIRANLVIHALGVLEDAAGDSELEARRRLREEGLRLLGDSALRRETLVLANLASALRTSGLPTDTPGLARTLETLLRRQGEDGCWLPSTAEESPDARIFTTLRCLLAVELLRPDGA